ncbi:MAG: hypothetical protein JHC73_20745 [Dolichospermum sp.]|uniref:hypothetical protein n=1 Tax=Dolichospermum sp. UHCC 0352 TaxID=2590011 RepID=UPI00144611A7|nr:hypothetical protein [Dolichospermum sp. UHCC 0352]MBJ7298663.1 hypothetical protein [Dolichospermum sp.]MTJ23174.1 hypothetical protein [Dolichospermum sp. UHCC 0352]
MSIHETKVNNFIHLLKTQASLFSLEDREEISQLIASEADEVKALSNAISKWLEEHTSINDALRKLKSESPESRAPGSTKPNPKIPKYETDKKALYNAIHQSSSDEKPDDKLEGNVSGSGGK